MSQLSSRQLRQAERSIDLHGLMPDSASSNDKIQEGMQTVPQSRLDYQDFSPSDVPRGEQAANASLISDYSPTSSMREQIGSIEGSILQISISNEDDDLQRSSLTNSILIAEFTKEAAAVDANTYTRSPSHKRRIKHGPTRSLIKSKGDRDRQETIKNASSGPVQADQQVANHGERPYTASLGIPDILGPGSSREPSESSDAGLQLRLRRSRKPIRTPSTTESFATLQTLSESAPARDSRFELQKRILTSFQKTKNYHGQEQDFLPEGELYKLIDTVSVRRELTREFGNIHSQAQIEDYTNEVCRQIDSKKGGVNKIKTFRKIFALLVIVGATSSILLFLDEDVSDLDLPLQGIGLQGIDGMCRRDESSTGTGKPLRCFEQPSWSPTHLRTFQEYQWKMLAPYFSQGKYGDVIHFTLHDQHILPFVITDSDDSMFADKAGGYSTVSMVQIHREHHNFQDKKLCARGFAVKRQLHDAHRDTFKTEIAVLKKFSGPRGHEHVVSLLATFEQFNKLNLIFYRADGDLDTYWSSIEQRPDANYANITWMAKQCDGLAQGLLKLHKHLTFTKKSKGAEEQSSDHETDAVAVSKTSHGKVRFDKAVTTRSNRRSKRIDSVVSLSKPTPGSDIDESVAEKQYGRHGDINPGNILWYDNQDGAIGALRGTLKIADFGQAELNSQNSRTQPRNLANTLTYRPPESDRLEQHNPPPIRQTYDIWCLGCVFLEFVAWMLGGEKLQEEFSCKRTSPDYSRNQQDTDTFFRVATNPDTNFLEVSIKPAVTQFIDELHRHPKCTEYCHALLNIIESDMLVVDSSKRETCERISRTLHNMSKRCRTDETFAAKPCPWFHRSTNFSPRPMLVQMPRADAQPIDTGAVGKARGQSNIAKKRQKRGEKRRAHGGFTSR